MEFTIEDTITTEVHLLVAGSWVVLHALLSEIECEGEELGDGDYTVRWTAASLRIVDDAESEEWLREEIIYPDDLDTGRVLADAQISDACDFAASEEYRRLATEGAIGA